MNNKYPKDYEFDEESSGIFSIPDDDIDLGSLPEYPEDDEEYADLDDNLEDYENYEDPKEEIEYPGEEDPLEDL